MNPFHLAAPGERRCPVCGTAPCKNWGDKGELRLVRCAACGMVYANPIPAGMDSGEFYQSRAQNYYLAPDKLNSDFAPVRFERELRWFRTWCRQGEILDVGCSTGAFLCQLQSRWPTDYRTTGTDVVGPALDYAATRGITVRRGPFLNDDFAGQSFDAITFWAVLEHLVSPADYLRQAVKLLRPGGLCFLLVPNVECLAVRLLGLRYRYIVPEHLNYFDARSLAALAAQVSGLALVQLGSTHFNPVVLWQDWRRGGNDFVPDGERAQLLRRTTGWKQNPWLQPLSWCYRRTEQLLGMCRLADNLIAVLRKAPSS